MQISLNTIFCGKPHASIETWIKGQPYVPPTPPEPDPPDFPSEDLSDPCTVSIPTSIVDGFTVNGTELDTSTGSMTISNKRVTSFQAKFSPGSLGQSADTISPVITFDRCVIATELEFYGDCAASGKPITIIFNNCIFDGSEHRKQFLFMQYGIKYEVSGGRLNLLDSSAAAKFIVKVNHIKFINLDPDKSTRALFKGFGSTYDRPDLEAGDHFNPSPDAQSQAVIMADADSAELITSVSTADKAYKDGAANQYYDFQAGSYGTVTNIRL